MPTTSRSTSTARLLSPIPYTADYFGHKVRVDQNEKLVMYGVTHVCARDGYSWKVVGFITMLIKKNMEIYTHLFRYYNINNNIVHYSYSIELFELLGLLQRNDPDIWTKGSGTHRSWK